MEIKFKLGDYFTHSGGHIFMLKRINYKDGDTSYDLCPVMTWATIEGRGINSGWCINYYEEITLKYSGIMENFEKMVRVKFGYPVDHIHTIKTEQQDRAVERLFLIERDKLKGHCTQI